MVLDALAVMLLPAVVARWLPHVTHLQLHNPCMDTTAESCCCSAVAGVQGAGAAAAGQRHGL